MGPMGILWQNLNSKVLDLWESYGKSKWQTQLTKATRQPTTPKPAFVGPLTKGPQYPVKSPPGLYKLQEISGFVGKTRPKIHNYMVVTRPIPQVPISRKDVYYGGRSTPYIGDGSSQPLVGNPYTGYI